MNDPDETIGLETGGNATGPNLVYLPGLHGDGTLATGLRRELGADVRWLGVIYPRTTAWTLADYANAIARRLNQEVHGEIWLLAESFGSQVAWALLELPEATRPRIAGVILAGGFVRHPWLSCVRIAQFIFSRAPRWLFGAALRTYALVLRLRHRSCTHTATNLNEFLARRLAPGDRDAMSQRFDLITGSKAESIASANTTPVFQLTGFWDPVVPWPGITRWLRRRCPGWRGRAVVPWADHAVLVTQPAAAARHIRSWLGLTPPSTDRRRPSG